MLAAVVHDGLGALLHDGAKLRRLVQRLARTYWSFEQYTDRQPEELGRTGLTRNKNISASSPSRIS